MHREQQDVLGFAEPYQSQAEQGTALQIERGSGFSARYLVCRPLAEFFRHRA
jgi:hypothetical protein